MTKARNLPNLVYNGTGIRLFPDLSLRTLKLRATLKPLLHRLQNDKIIYLWGYTFSLTARHGSTVAVLRRPEDLPAFLETFKLSHVPLPDWCSLFPPCKQVPPPVLDCRKHLDIREDTQAQDLGLLICLHILRIEIYRFTSAEAPPLSYSYIVRQVLRIPTNTGRQKAFSTCSSHLIVVSIFYWTLFSVYIVPTKGQTLNMRSYEGLLTARPMENNQTVITEFFLLGFQVRQDLRIFLFCLLFLIYCGTICGNLLIITLVSTSKNLHTPMYFFISQLSISDIWVSSDIIPKLLHILLNNGGTMTFIGCIAQFYFLCASETFECFLLAVMSYDRYVAICNPLRYSSIMTSAHCEMLTTSCALLGFSIILIYIITITKQIFCGSNVIDHIFCDVVPLLELSCSDTFIVHLEIYILSIPLVFIPTIIIVVSYTYIVLAILRIPSNTGRQKAFSTCSSHLIVVSIFYWTIFSVYVVPGKGQTVTMSKILSLLYTVFTPLVNPIIYSLRNKNITKAIKETLRKCEIW
ncbi:olfactory receptor 11L1-like [Hyla sarda]|uniref:olfactory receptor 11L1-like n=1 Tax=Hyla sarda TaxID=327740 RepID=UPI0024C3DC36|nr:olfactory receptor 11L1-like [Hyla sarda]